MAAPAEGAAAGDRLTTVVADAGDWEQPLQRIVLVGSVAGHKNSPGNLHGATKWAITGLADNLRMLFAPPRVGVSLVLPGVVDTAFYAAGSPEVHLGPADMADAVCFVLESPSGVDVNTLVVPPRRQPV